MDWVTWTRSAAAGEVQAVGEGGEVAEVPKFHGPRLSIDGIDGNDANSSCHRRFQSLCCEQTTTRSDLAALSGERVRRTFPRSLDFPQKRDGSPGGRWANRRNCMLFPTTIVGSFPQPDWLIDPRQAGRPVPAAGAGQRALARRRAVPRRGPGRRDAARHPGAGGRRARHRFRRGDPPGKLLEPFRDGAGRRRPRQPRHGARPLRPPQPGAPHRRAHPSQARGGGGGPEVPEAAHDSPHQDHRARPVHDAPAGAERLLRDRRGGGPRLRGCGERRDQRPVRRGRGRRADRRAVHAGAAREGARSTG